MDRLSRWLIGLAARIGPPGWRKRGLPEWEGELWALRRRGAGTGTLIRFSLDAVLHAVWQRREEGMGMSGLGQDLRFAFRRLGRTPGFTTITVVILALGIGANTALFSALQAALAGSGRYGDAERLVMVDLLQRNQESTFDTLPWSYPKFEFARARMRSIEAVAGFAGRDLTLNAPGDAGRLGVELVSPAYFALLGIDPLLGRTFLHSEEPPSPAAVAILGHSVWTTRFGGDPDVVGRSLTVEGGTYEVVGVMPLDFRGITGRAELWLPMAAAPVLLSANHLERPWLHWFRAIGRLGSGVTVAQARAELAATGAAMTEALPDPFTGHPHGVTAVPFLSARVNPVARLAIASVSAGGLLLLLIACANVASLLLARASVRRTDVAVRAALGAGRGRLLREHMLESLVLSCAGGAVGLLLALLGEGLIARATRYALETSGTRSLQYLDPAAMGVDGTALAAGVLLALATGLLCGVLPLRVASRPDLGRDLHGGSRRVLARLGGSGESARGLLVATQLALTLVLLAGAGLMGASLANLAAIEPGFTHDSVLTLRFERGSDSATPETWPFEEELLTRLGALPGVVSVATAPCPPLVGPCEVTGVRQVDDQPPVDFAAMEGVVTYQVSDDYFSTLGIAVREGRVFDRGERAGDPPVAIVSEGTARRLFGGSALGHRISLTHSLTEATQAAVVGIVADVRHGSLEVDPMPAVYLSRRQDTPRYGTLFLRTEGDPHGLVEAVRAEVRSLDPDLPLFEISTLGELRAAATARTRVILALLLAFALVGLLLSAVGIYGVVSYAVLRRTRELGLRLALGAPAAGLVRLVVGRPVSLALAGASAGLLGALALTRLLQGLLYRVEPQDPRVMGGAAALLVTLALVAAWLPARRALRVDPAETLRGE